MLSMRSVGYTFEASVADLIDNSVAAGADNISILTGGPSSPFIAFLDDGFGMNESTLVSAMTLGAADPTAPRSNQDLGRFGLGLKTASLAHARCLTVLSKQDGHAVAARWDLDDLKQRGRWELHLLSETEIESVPCAERLQGLTCGTLVVWTELDTFEASVGDMHKGLDEALSTLRDHLGLVFHRFLAGDASRISIDINGNRIEGADPFLEKHKKTIQGPDEFIRVEGSMVVFRSFTLPVPSELTAADREKARARNGLRDTQGFYIYRNKRLVVAGSWFGMRPRQELDKLTRVRLDIPNTLDHLWQLDVKKSTAHPPAVVRQKVRHLMDHTTAPSQRALKFRGRTVQHDPIQRVWNLVQDRDSFRYEINRKHPVVTQWLAASPADDAESLLRMLEETAPWEDAYARSANDETVLRKAIDPGTLTSRARDLAQALMVSDATQLLAMLRNIEPFSSIPEQQLLAIAQEALNA